MEEAEQELASATTSQKKEILRAKRAVAEAKGRFPLNISSIISAQQTLRDLEAGLKDLEDLKAELF